MEHVAVTYSPKGSMTNRVRQFFADNPDEELTVVDLCRKFDVTKAQAHVICQELAKQGAIEKMFIVRAAQRETA